MAYSGADMSKPVEVRQIDHAAADLGPVYILATNADVKRRHRAHQTFTGAEDLDHALHAAVMKLNIERNRHPSPNPRIAA